MKKQLSIFIYILMLFLIFPKIFMAEDPAIKDNQIQLEKYNFSKDLLRTLRYCIQHAKIAGVTSQVGKNEIEINQKLLSDEISKLSEIEEQLEIIENKMYEEKRIGKDLRAIQRDLKSINKSKPLSDLSSINGIHQSRDKLIQAKTVMEIWKDNKDENIRKVSEQFLSGIDDLIFAMDQFLILINDKEFITNQQNKDLFDRIVNSGQTKILESSLRLFEIIVFSKGTKNQPVQFCLTEEQLLSIVQIVDEIFNEEFQENEKQYPAYIIAPLWGIKYTITKSIADQKIQRLRETVREAQEHGYEVPPEVLKTLRELSEGEK